MPTLPVIATMIGDPAGVGPEVAVKAVGTGELDDLCVPLLIGDIGVLQRAAAICGVTRPLHKIDSIAGLAPRPDTIQVLDPGGYDGAGVEYGIPSAGGGRAVLEWSRIATGLGKAGQIHGLVVGPKNSAAMKLAGSMAVIGMPAPGTFMLRMSGPLRVVPLSEHYPLAEALAMIQPELVLQVIRLLHENLVKWGLPQPRIAVAGINPHAMFEQDHELIAPAVDEARASGIDVSGPIVPDAVFRMAIKGKFDAVVTMYHDQGQIAIKTVSFDGACTVHLGLPFIRIGVPHGTAFDIAGKGVAEHGSMLSSMKTAAMLAAGKGVFRN